ncbi:GIY-YIG nuclease family protein [Citrobacter braakii]|uniref:GIY-YIG nuclease family protein n=1 Tax=Citrobacter freundii complex TaxID=1344959 RepID=UPI00204CC6A4|nr:GIY-YIG nuclease family protein [Citrobacter freundii]DAZ18014.1 MAG TPA: GIY-YIG nuclease superfamily protein [Caudoviricetes sp.]EKV4110587.1 GIY-YIG nuclease family protein [Citrobacter freundii]HBN5192204.1 GIY-YIG nuclease family protein [Citrobacter freundii]HBU6551862.1 GIY-YIG nuclease family protein [Citrobacter freundii]HBV8467949.1 GIY-YIG nuclease family protein [Citrobacter freundii]
MTGKTINLQFDGYWREANKSGVPDQSGIYCVYACKAVTNGSKTTLEIRKLIYIGESSNVRSRVATHDRLGDWNEHLMVGETLCYSVATITGKDDRVRAEAALINKMTPPANSEYTGEFPYNETTVNCSGETSHLLSTLTVG